MRDPGLLERIRRLAVPPAWTDVWISPDPRGHLQATGRDARGRKQYRYHPAFRVRRDVDKYERMVRFARALPRIRRRAEHDLGLAGLPRDKILAATIRLLERTLIRVGHEEYARDNQSYGLATLRDRHARVDGGEIRFRFRGKAGVIHEVDLRDRRLAGIVRRCRDLPGQELFQYVDTDGEVRDVRSDDVNAYLRDAARSDEFSAKDFRTWSGTVLAFRAMAATGQLLEARRPPDRAIQQGLRRAIEATAERLGNTPTVARQSYVHPAVIDAYLDDDVRGAILKAADADALLVIPPTAAEERAVLRLLEDRTGRRRRARRPRPARPATGSTPPTTASGAPPSRRPS